MLLLYTCIIILTWLSSDRWRNHLRRWAYRQLWLVILFINSGFFQLILSPVPADVFTRRVLSCIWLRRREMRARSSAKSRSLSCVRSDHCIPMFLSDVLVLMILSITERKRNGDNRHAYRTPQTIEHLVSMGKPACHALVGVVDQGRAFRVLHSVSISTMSFGPRCRILSWSRWS